MEAYSVEDDGEGICFNVFCYNAQPQITIDYKTGESWLTGDQDNEPQITLAPQNTSGVVELQPNKYIINTKTKKYHREGCGSVQDIKEENKMEYIGTSDELDSDGYRPCQNCKPD